MRATSLTFAVGAVLALTTSCDDESSRPSNDRSEADSGRVGAPDQGGWFDVGGMDLSGVDVSMSGEDAGATSDGSEADASAADISMMTCPTLGTPLGAGIAPPRRDDAAAAFDPECGRLFMFFGDQGVPQNCSFSRATFSNEGFVFDARTSSWSSLGPQTGPSPSDRAGAVWDPQRKRVVLFGGRWRAGNSGPYSYPTPVWAYDPATNQWSTLANDPNGPRGRMDFIMVSDPGRDRFIISHGGRFTPDFTAFEVESDAWAFNLADNTWRRLGVDGTQPEPLVYPSGALDARRDQLWVFSGSGQDAFVGLPRREMWLLNLQTDSWEEVSYGVGFPEARFNAAIIWDESRDRLVLFAGHDPGANASQLGNANDLWSFDLENRTWSQIRIGDTFNKPAFGFCDFPGDFTNADLASPERRAAHVFAGVDPGFAVTYGGNTDCGLANDTWSLDLSNDTWSQVTVSPSGMTCPRTGNPNCSDPSVKMCD